MKKDLSKLVKRCQGNCGRVISNDGVLVVKSYGTIQQRETNETEKSRLGPIYIHFQEKCLRGYDKDTYYGPGKRFDYSVIRVDEKCLTQLPNAEKNFLKNLDLKFNSHVIYSINIFPQRPNKLLHKVYVLHFALVFPLI